MPTLEWIGKDKVVNHHQEVPYRVLERQYSYDETGQHAEDNGSENMIIHGDNLEALKALLPRYEGKVKCIYIDPPYNTGNEGWVYNDNVNDPKIKKWLGEVVGKEGEDLSRHDKWLCMMYPRLKLLQRLLAEDGVIFISIDDNELYNLKSICDEIFGLSCFVSNISWQRTYSTRNDSKGMYNYQPSRLARSNIPKQNFSHDTNVVCNGSPSRIRIVRRISFGITTRPRSSIRLTIPVAFISMILRIFVVRLYSLQCCKKYVEIRCVFLRVRRA